MTTELPGGLPPLKPLPEAESRLLARRRRGRNIATLVVLLALAALFYAVAMVKMAGLLDH